MVKRKKGGDKGKPDSYITLITAIVNMVIALLLLYEKLKS